MRDLETVIAKCVDCEYPVTRADFYEMQRSVKYEYQKVEEFACRKCGGQVRKTVWDTWQEMQESLGCTTCTKANKKKLGKGECCSLQKPLVELNIDKYGKCIDKVCNHANIRWDRESDRQEVSGAGVLSSPFITHFYECPDCGEDVEGETEGGV